MRLIIHVALPIFVWVTLAVCSLAMSDAERAEGHRIAINKADYLVRQAKYVEALAAAEDAMALDGTDYAGYYYAGLALYRMEIYDQAEIQAKKGMERVPPEKKGVMEQLQAEITRRKNFLQRLKDGDQAMVQGLKNKAAGTYTEAWKLNPEREDVGLKAAGLWCSMKDYVNCVKILREVSGKDTETSRQAEAMYKSLDSALYDYARRETEAAWHILEGVQVRDKKIEPRPNFTAVSAEDLDEAIAHFSRAADTLPRKAEKSALYGHDMPHVGLATVHAFRNDLEGATTALQRAISEHHLLILPEDRQFFDKPRKYDEVAHPREPRRIDYWAPLLCTSGFQDFLLDAFGTGVVELARDLCRGR